jgi:pantoate--beta-alanine ligase
MQLAQKIVELEQALTVADTEGRRVGFIPTMGALHKGHLSLVNKAQEQGLFIVVSVFVNPRQFGDGDDLENYPRTLGVDARVLSDAGVDVLFAPSSQEIYPASGVKEISAGELGNLLEGTVRQGHFDGMLTVVNRLFNLVQPDVAFFGSKDAQQLMLVTQMVKRQVANGDREPIKVVACETVRDDQGLALSSRNQRIPSELMPAARTLHRALVAASTMKTKAACIKAAKAELDPIIRLDYLELVDPETFAITEGVEGARMVIAGWVGEVRLIDNLVIGGI